MKKLGKLQGSLCLYVLCGNMFRTELKIEIFYPLAKISIINLINVSALQRKFQSLSSSFTYINEKKKHKDIPEAYVKALGQQKALELTQKL